MFFGENIFGDEIIFDHHVGKAYGERGPGRRIAALKGSGGDITDGNGAFAGS